jgi:hypothetical protein
MPGKGPDIKTLSFLSGMLPSLAKHVGRGKPFGRKVTPEKRPRKICTVCMRPFDYAAVGDDFQPGTGICEQCTGLLQEGYIAFTCGGEYAFARHPHLADMAGKIVKLQPETFDKLRLKFHFKQHGAEQPPGRN